MSDRLCENNVRSELEGAGEGGQGFVCVALRKKPERKNMRLHFAWLCMGGREGKCVRYSILRYQLYFGLI